MVRGDWIVVKCDWVMVNGDWVVRCKDWLRSLKIIYLWKLLSVNIIHSMCVVTGSGKYSDWML